MAILVRRQALSSGCLPVFFVLAGAYSLGTHSSLNRLASRHSTKFDIVGETND